ncbi:MAG: 2-dehydro-3-deoxy-6-phosphogalactonate aldolase [Lentisphaeria bacterium]
MKKHKIFETYLQETPIIAILRGITPKEIGPVCDILLEAGIKLLEIPLNTPDALDCIRTAVKYCQNKQLVGAGTVLTPEDVVSVANAGGEFIISPNTFDKVIQKTVALNLISIPGFMTASEGFDALRAGADYLKLFPAGNLGTSYVKNLQAVLKAPLIAVGGVGPQNIADFLQIMHGAGIGSSLYKVGKSLADIKKSAADLLDHISK